MVSVANRSLGNLAPQREVLLKQPQPASPNHQDRPSSGTVDNAEFPIRALLKRRKSGLHAMYVYHCSCEKLTEPPTTDKCLYHVQQ